MTHSSTFTFKIFRLKPSQTKDINVKSMSPNETNFMKRVLIFLAIICFCNIGLYSQTIGTDSEGKSVYEFQKSETFTIPLSSADNSLMINYSKKLGKGRQYYGDRSTNAELNSIYEKSRPAAISFIQGTSRYSADDSTRLTMAKSYAVNISLKAANLLSNYAKISTFHPVYSLGVGFGHNIDVFNNWKNIQLLKYPFYNWNVSLGLNVSEVKIYDTLTKTLSPYRRKWTQSINANGSLYFPSNNRNSMFAFSTVLSYERSNNIEDLKKVQERKDLYIDDNITSQGDYIGRLGDFARQNRVRGSFSVNFFPNSLDFSKDTIQLCIIGFVSVFGPTNSHLNKLFGLYINASQGKSLFSNNSTIAPGLGAGVNWVGNSHGLSQISIFIRGSLDIQTFFSHRPSGQLSRQL